MRRALSLLAFATLACGSAPPPPAPVPPPPSAPEPLPVVSAPLPVTGQLGSIDQGATEETFRRLEQPFMACHRRGMGRLRYLGGDVQLFVRVTEQGAAKSVALERSTLGDRDTEKCMLEAASRSEWPRPIGGEAEVRKSLGFDPPSDVRKPMAWPVEKIEGVLHKKEAELRKCKGDESRSYFITMYVVPAKRKQGKVQAVGVSPPAPGDDDKAACMAKALKGTPTPSPGSYAAKVSFSF